jgi:hypothetical protein
MLDKSALQTHAEDAMKPAGEAHGDLGKATVESAKNEGGENQSDPRRDIFDERFHAIMDPFGQACEQHQMDVAIAIAMHADDTQPIVFVRGHEFDAASLMGKVLRRIQDHLMRELTGQGANPDDA